MTEEELAASLGLTETAEMTALRPDLLRLAPLGDEAPTADFVEVLSRYQKLGEKAVDAKSGPGDYFRMSAQIALILLSASIRRDIAADNLTYADHWAEDLNDALMYVVAYLLWGSVSTLLRPLNDS